MANFCPQCGNPTDADSLFCKNCGTKLRVTQPDTPEQPAYTEPSQQVPVEPAQNTASQVSAPKPAPQQVPPAYTQPSQQAPIPPASETSWSAPAQNTGKPASGTRSRLPLIIGVAAAVVILLFVVPNFFKQKAPQEPIETPPPVSTPEPELIVTDTPLPTAEPVPATPEPTDVPQDIADFLRYNIPADCVLNQPYRCPAVYGGDSKELVYGTLTFLEYESTPVTDEIIRFGNENNMDLRGYDRRILKAKVVFDDDQIEERGAIIRRFYTDYYDINQVDNSHETLTDSYEENYYRFLITYNGEPTYAYMYTDGEWSESGAITEFNDTTTLLVPSGYDGVVRGFVSPLIDDVTVDNSPDAIFLFRMK